MRNIGGRPSRTLLYEDVVNDLYTLIDESQLQPGDKLPPERELTEKLGISRKTVSNRLKALKEKGVIHRVGSDTKGYWEISQE